MSDKTTNIELAIPIEKEGSEPITHVELRKPYAGELRGLSFTKVLEMDFDTMATLIPRISDLKPRDLINLEPENITPLFVGVAGFFVITDTKSQIE